MRFTLDNNCLLAVEKREQAASDIDLLVQAHAVGKVEVAVLGISASERQLGGGYLSNIDAFRNNLDALGLSHLTIYKPTGIWGVTFNDWSVYASRESISLERQIHDAMFPSSEFEWRAVAAAAGEEIENESGKSYRKWRNRRCDVQGMLAHILNNGDVFVSNDKHFLKNIAPLIKLGAGEIIKSSDLPRILHEE